MKLVEGVSGKGQELYSEGQKPQQDILAFCKQAEYGQPRKFFVYISPLLQ